MKIAFVGIIKTGKMVVHLYQNPHLLHKKGQQKQNSQTIMGLTPIVYVLLFPLAFLNIGARGDFIAVSITLRNNFH